MNPAELIAYRAGVRAVVDLAERIAAAMDARAKEKPTRYPFAAEALRGLAEEADALLQPEPSSDPASSLKSRVLPDGHRGAAGGKTPKCR